MASYTDVVDNFAVHIPRPVSFVQLLRSQTYPQLELLKDRSSHSSEEPSPLLRRKKEYRLIANTFILCHRLAGSSFIGLSLTYQAPKASESGIGCREYSHT